jgi:hypothetical protein
MRRIIWRFIFLFISALFIPFGLLDVDAATLNWIPSDGNPAGYKVHYGARKSALSNHKDVGNVTTYNIDQLPLSENVQYFFSVSAYNAYGESEACTPVGYTPGDTTPPLRPTELIALSTGDQTAPGQSQNQTNSPLISGLYVKSGKAYSVQSGIANGRKAYIDRSYTYGNVPSSMQGATYIVTANDDKNWTGWQFISFDADRDVVVYVAHDDRVADKPDWMASFSDTGMEIETDFPMSLYKKRFPKGRITLGGNGNAPSHSMYTILVK